MHRCLLSALRRNELKAAGALPSAADTLPTAATTPAVELPDSTLANVRDLAKDKTTRTTASAAFLASMGHSEEAVQPRVEPPSPPRRVALQLQARTLPLPPNPAPAVPTPLDEPSAATGVWAEAGSPEEAADESKAAGVDAQLAEHSAGPSGEPGVEAPFTPPALSKLCNHLNERTRAAKAVSMESDQLFLSLFFKDRCEITTGVVTGYVLLAVQCVRVCACVYVCVCVAVRTSVPL